ncbi:MAG TPA: LysM peptidoglycan-binding domain-containing protein [Beutenbergiaceae bacterium]|nr:LysM peptidoglycan-binding domain-containing protein [Beutenbergiaceae bacterium]
MTRSKATHRNTSSRLTSTLTAAGALGAATAVGLGGSTAPAHADTAPADPSSQLRAPGHLSAELSAAFLPKPQQIAVPSRAKHVSAAPAPRSSSATLYTVQAGDTVSHLALRYQTTISAIVAENSLNAQALIRIGQVLRIPAGAGEPAAGSGAGGGGGAMTSVGSSLSTSGTSASGASHTVQAGDTVWDLARQYDSTVGAIISANDLNSNAVLQIGQSLTIPGGSSDSGNSSSSGSSSSSGGSSSSASSSSSSSSTSNAASHTVRAGETVWDLARQYGSTVSQIVSANNLDSNAVLQIGQSLTIPGSSSSSSSSGGSSSSASSSSSDSAEQLVPNTFLHYTYPDDVVAAANENKATLLSMDLPGQAQMQNMVREVATSMGVDPALALAVAQQESGFNQDAVSPANAIGTMQVIPSSGDWASDLVGRQLNLLDPLDNVTAGVAILRALERTSDDLPTAIAGYYQGAGSVERNGMFSDTSRYVANVQTLMTRFS